MKQSGLGDAFYIAGVDLSGDIGSLGSIHGGPAVHDVTGIDKSAMERIGGLRDGSIEFTAFFNDAVGQSHLTLKANVFTQVLDFNATYCRGTALGGEAAFIVARQLNYDQSRAQDGALTSGVTEAADGFGLDWGRQITAGKRTDKTAT